MRITIMRPIGIRNRRSFVRTATAPASPYRDLSLAASANVESPIRCAVACLRRQFYSRSQKLDYPFVMWDALNWWDCSLKSEYRRRKGRGGNGSEFRSRRRPVSSAERESRLICGNRGQSRLVKGRCGTLDSLLVGSFNR
jgi:hypothetical protein